MILIKLLVLYQFFSIWDLFYVEYIDNFINMFVLKREYLWSTLDAGFFVCPLNQLC